MTQKLTDWQRAKVQEMTRFLFRSPFEVELRYEVRQLMQSLRRCFVLRDVYRIRGELWFLYNNTKVEKKKQDTRKVLEIVEGVIDEIEFGGRLP